MPVKIDAMETTQTPLRRTRVVDEQPGKQYYLYIKKISAMVAHMALNIKDPATEKFVRELAAAAGESVTTAVRRAAEERLERMRRQGTGRSIADEILEIGRRCAAWPDLDARTAEEILGYDEHGLPH